MTGYVKWQEARAQPLEENDYDELCTRTDRVNGYNRDEMVLPRTLRDVIATPHVTRLYCPVVTGSPHVMEHSFASSVRSAGG